jgi:hypothetical protein
VCASAAAVARSSVVPLNGWSSPPPAAIATLPADSARTSAVSSAIFISSS